LNAPIIPEELERKDMQDLILEKLLHSDRTLKILDKNKLCQALEEYVEKASLATITETTERMLIKAQEKYVFRHLTFFSFTV